MLICHQNLWRSEENMGKKRYSRAHKKNNNKNDSMKEKPTKAIRNERDREKQRKKNVS